MAHGKISWPLRFPVLAAAITLLAISGAPAGIRAFSAPAKPHRVIATYFHTNTRCSTCEKIEAYSREAIEQGFKKELRNGTLELRVINYEKPQNRHYVKKYQLVTKSLILAKEVDGEQTEWTNLKLVWQLAKNREAFLNYVRGEIRKYLPEG